MSPSTGPRPARRYRDDGKPARRLTEVQARQRDMFLGSIEDGSYHWEIVPVCLCGSGTVLSVSEKDRFGIPVGVVLCGTCGLLRTSPRLAAENLPEFYDRDYHALHMGIAQPKPTTALFRTGQGSAIFDVIRPYLAPGPLVVAEIGAGVGGVLREFGEAAGRDGRVAELIGCEYAQAYAEVAREAGTDVRQGGVEALVGMPKPDVLIMSHVLEHFADPVAELARIRTLIRPETLVYVEVPGLMTLHSKAQYEYDLLQYLTLAHTYHFTLATLTDVMRRAGFRLLVGDEEVRSVFRDEGSESADEARVRDSLEAARVTRYLISLDRSPRVRVRRVTLHIAHGTKQSLKAAVRTLIGDDGVEIVRRLRRRRSNRRGRPDG